MIDDSERSALSSGRSSVWRYRFDLHWKMHATLWRDSLNLLAGQNAFSGEVGKILCSDIGNRVLEHYRHEALFPGLEHYEAIENLGIELCRSLFDCEDVELRPVTGTIANIIVYTALLRPGNSVASLSLKHGSHVSAGPRLLAHLGFCFIPLPFNEEDLVIDGEKAIQIILERKPNLVILGGSVMLFQFGIREICDAVHGYGGTVLFDASHTIGLIIGGKAPNPLREGADLIMFTTSKTIPGPQHAIVMGRHSKIAQVRDVCTLFHSGYHLHEMVAAIYSLIEMEYFGKEYADAMVINAQALGRSLNELGLAVVHDSRKRFTDTNMLLLDVRKFGGGKLSEDSLAKVGIFTNRNVIPSRNEQGPDDPHGIRIGTAEVTRLGMGPAEMVEIASLIARGLGPPEGEAGKNHYVTLLNDVTLLRHRFASIKYAFDRD